MSLTPRRVHRFVAVAEAITWGLLLAGMFLKYVTKTTELGVQIFGMLHGIAFIAYGLVTLVVWIDQRWSFTRGALGLLAAIPPFATLLFERYAAPDDPWQSREDSETALQRGVCWLLRHHRLAIPLGLVAVAGLTGVALLVGPPA